MNAVLLSIQIGQPKQMGTPDAADPMDQPWYSAFYKDPISGSGQLTKWGIVGDGVADRENHGLPEMAALCYAEAHYSLWRAEFGSVDFCFGGFGENFTLRGIDECSVCIGDVYTLGSATVQVTQPRQPCWKLGRRWRLKELPARVIANGRSGWYVKVLKEGDVGAGDEMILTERPHPSWTVARVNDQFYRGKGDLDSAAELANLGALSFNWRGYFARRIENIP